MNIVDRGQRFKLKSSPSKNLKMHRKPCPHCLMKIYISCLFITRCNSTNLTIFPALYTPDMDFILITANYASYPKAWDLYHGSQVVSSTRFSEGWVEGYTVPTTVRHNSRVYNTTDIFLW